MAKKSLIQKNKKIYKYKKKKIFIFCKFKKFSIKYCFFLQKIKKYFFTKFINRCYITGRQRSFYNRFSLNRNLIRKIGSFGYIVGLQKSSW